jgi:T5SS/PEP-CTERM-associated repeat protein
MKRIPTLVLVAGLSCLLSPSLHAQPVTNWTFNYTGSITNWTALYDGLYTITAYGAEGGGSALGSSGGQGARAGGTFSLSSGFRLNILSGGSGASGSAAPYGGGGGGGSFVVDLSTNPLVVAGGGGGGGYTEVSNDNFHGPTEADPGNDASLMTSGTSDASGEIVGGTNGFGGSYGSSTNYGFFAGGGNGGGGGGLLGAGGSYTNYSGSIGIGGGSSYLEGGGGGQGTMVTGSGKGEVTFTSPSGGFGGGGQAGQYSGGGGGGYSGGGGGAFEVISSQSDAPPETTRYGYGGGGGGSFVASSASNTFISIGNTGNGSVSIAQVITNLMVGDNSSSQSYAITSGNSLYGNVALGVNAGDSNNSISVANAGTVLNALTNVAVGVGGSGNSLLISNGGKVVTGDLGSYIGASATSTGNSVVVTGSGSAWENGSFLNVGSSGSDNTLTVSDGGSVTAEAFTLGYFAGSTGNSVVVSGGGSISSSSTYIGNAGGNNSVLVTGSGSTWSNRVSFFAASPLYIGWGGTNSSLTVADGGNVAAPQTTIAANHGSSVTLNIGRFGTNDAAGTVSTPTIAFGAGTGTINFNQSNSTTISAPISGNGSVNQLGSGTTILAGHNTYTGPTTVAAGDLVVNGSIANSTVTVNNGGTLSGSGSVGGIVLNLGGTINPGNSPGTHSVAGNVVWNAGANYNWQIHDVQPGGAGTSTGWDLMSATGTLDLSVLTVGSEFNINLWLLSGVAPDANGPALNFDPNQNYTWTILSAAGGISGFTGSSQFVINTAAINGTGGFANGLGGGSFSVAQSGNDLNLVFTAAAAPGAPVPEPGTWAAAALLVGGAALLRWRRRVKAEVLDRR